MASQETPASPSSSRRALVIVLTLVLACAVIAGGYFFTQRGGSSSSSSEKSITELSAELLTVPDLSGMTATEAKAALKDAGFITGPKWQDKAEAEPVANLDEWVVVEQEPAAGATDQRADAFFVITVEKK